MDYVISKASSCKIWYWRTASYHSAEESVPKMQLIKSLKQTNVTPSYLINSCSNEFWNSILHTDFLVLTCWNICNSKSQRYWFKIHLVVPVQDCDTWISLTPFSHGHTKFIAIHRAVSLERNPETTSSGKWENTHIEKTRKWDTPWP